MRLLIFVLFVLCVVKWTKANLDHLDVEVEYQCIQHCPLQNRTDAGNCDYGCNINQCAKGCKLWKGALNSSCQTVCNGPVERLKPKEFYCVMGCNDAMTKYFSLLKSKLLIPPAPALVADSRNATSLKLEWNFPRASKLGLTYHVQWKYEDIPAKWEFCRNPVWSMDDTVVFIDNLQPFTKYRFRIVLLLGHQDNAIISSPSVVITTLASGRPVSAPSSVRVAPIDCTRISVSWEPGPFPHGPLLSYVLQINDNHPDAEVHSEVKDIPPETNYYIARNLRPGNNYTILVKMRNGVGSGPPAEKNVSTPSEPLTKDTQKPVVILGTKNAIIQLGPDILDDPETLYSSPFAIRGIGIHITKQIIFISDSNGTISKFSLKNHRDQKNVTQILWQRQLNSNPYDLSVDWLNEQLYILSKVKMEGQTFWQITRCDLDGKGLTVALAGLRTKPNTMEVDPYNGYLFYSISGNPLGSLYRLDISDISNGIKHKVQPDLILSEPELGAFTVDHPNFRVLVSSQNTMLTVSLDGTEVVNARPHVMKTKFHNVISLAYANKKFYWTDGEHVFYEERHDTDYFHNSFPNSVGRSYSKVIINLQTSQPIPIPVNPPINVQAIFGKDIAKVKWQSPHLLGIQGKGAWQNWSYEIAIKETHTENFMYQRTNNATSFKITNLKDDTEYVIKAAAFTLSGKSPWSSEFRGRTLSKNKNPVVFWSTEKGLLKSDAAGENVETLMHKSEMKDFYFVDMTWYKDQIYLVTNDSHVYWYNLRNHDRGMLNDIDSVGSIAVDWIGKKLYWSNPKRQMIIRGNLNGTQQEPLPILTFAKELNIDSVKAYLYWSTGFAVRCAHLNGEDSLEYHPVKFFSGKEVMGLTLDMDHKFVYWIVSSSEGSNLFRAPMAGYTDKFAVETVSSLHRPNIEEPLSYFHKRLLWLQDDRNAAISDLQGKNIATISSKSMSGISLVYVVDSSLHVIPDSPTGRQIVVIPEMVDRNSVRVIGSLDSFNITWQPIKTVNYGTVFYEINVDSLSRNDSSVITTETSIKYWQKVPPFSKLHVTISAFTYWGSSPQIRAKIHSPASTPSSPRNLRTYVTHEQINGNNNAKLTIRWDAPMFPNGLIEGYRVHCYYFQQEKVDVCKNTTVPSNVFQVELSVVNISQTYFFNVEAFSEMGNGNLSETVKVNASVELPLPRLLVASENSIMVVDIDSNENYQLLHGINMPMEIGYLMKESKLLWINHLQDLMMYNLKTSNKTKLDDLKKNAKDLTIDWLERSLYYIQNIEAGASVHKIDLNYIDKGLMKSEEIFSTAANISSLSVSPFAKKLYWIENNRLMISNTDGSELTEFFSRSLRSSEDELIQESSCNCSIDTSIDKTYTLDHSDKNKPIIIYIDLLTQNLMSSDKDACLCHSIANRMTINSPEVIKSDFKSIYWLNSDNELFAYNKQDSSVISKNLNAQDLLIYGPHMQPFPAKECLTPNQEYNRTVALKYRSSNSLRIVMPEQEVLKSCAGISIATVEYQIYYVQDNAAEITECEKTNCNFTRTFEKEYTVENLKPFTNYTFFVALTNFYTAEDEVIIGAPVTFQTAVGAPSQPQNVSAQVLTPTMVKVTWLPPEEFNGATVHYELYWKTESRLSGLKPKEQPIVEQQISPNATQYLTTILTKLSPNETYTIWVGACSELNETSSDSEKVQVVTYPEPNELVLLNKTSTILKLAWEISPHVRHYTIQYSPITFNEWQSIPAGDRADGNIMIIAENLNPKTQYKFRLVLTYQNYSDEYVWPPETRFVFETLGDRPSPPGIPKIQYVKHNIYKVYWEPSRENGAPIEMYKLEALELPNYRNKRSTNRTAFFHTAPSIEEEEREWQTFYNGTETSWIIDGLSDKFKYEFRVLALNAYGWSHPSDSSNAFDLNEAARMAEKQSPMTLIVIATLIPVSVCLLIILCILCLVGRYSKPKKVQVVAIPRGPDVELATLRELPRRGIHNTNVLYSATQPNEDLTLLPHIRRDQITLMKFLGSGAFGEVFEGKAKGVPNCSSEVKVAVKTLRKGASDQEKTEFLQEAQLMSNFKHEHILQLLGVCLDNDPHFIIMELMQGGDLLTYLRSSRNLTTDTPPLTLIELLKMCVDVARGCRYLEEMHFVHRDLACRNCLVSSKETDTRIVKIGDFGLARDIYKNDYYRKEGEGLLPVRWMAPESLVDGVFTSQSDVWAFGVLLWEIMTLGQQPYPARNNLQVLDYVKRGGRLGKPTDCPEALHNLMLKCWEFEADKRPTFKYCLDILENLHFQNLRRPTTGAHEGQYISTVQDYVQGISNQAYFLDENSNAGDIDDELHKEKTPFLPSDHATPSIPKYLELVYEPSESPPPNDGYEIPNQMLQQINDQSEAIVTAGEDVKSVGSSSTNDKLLKIDEIRANGSIVCKS